jgi:hypothetical protein
MAKGRPRKATTLEKRFAIRCTDADKERWADAARAAGYDYATEWGRDLIEAEANRLLGERQHERTSGAKSKRGK